MFSSFQIANMHLLKLLFVSGTLLAVSLAESCVENVDTFDVKYYKNSEDYIDENNEVEENDKDLDFLKTVESKYYVHIANGFTATFCAEIVKDLSKVTGFKVRNFGITEIANDAFKSLTKLEILHIAENDLYEIPTGVFNNLPIRELYLEENGIVDIDPSAFDDMPNLEIINLDYNRIYTISSDWFTNTPNINTLYLGYNLIEEIPEKAFHYMKSSNDCDLDEKDTKCSNIWLEYNVIDYIHPSAFEGLKNVNQLILNNNALYEMTPIYGDLKINSLSLEYNDIAYVSKEVLKTLQYTNYTYLIGNPLTNKAIGVIDKFNDEKLGYILYFKKRQ